MDLTEDDPEALDVDEVATATAEGCDDDCSRLVLPLQIKPESIDDQRGVTDQQPTLAHLFRPHKNIPCWQKSNMML